MTVQGTPELAKKILAELDEMYYNIIVWQVLDCRKGVNQWQI